MTMNTTAVMLARPKRAVPVSLVAGGVILGFVAVIAALAGVLSPASPTTQDLLAALQSPSAAHPFGTDALGRDIFSRVLHGAQYELSVIVPTVLIVVVVGVPIGIVAAYRRGFVDRLVSLVSDSVLSFPAMVLAIVLVAVIGNGYLSIVVTIALTQLPQMVRYARGFTSSVAGADYITASRASGARTTLTLIRHVVPNIAGSVFVVASLFASEVLLIVAALGFLGIGVQPPTPEWGTMLSEGRQDFMASPQVMLFPGLAIAVMILGFNLLGDGLRDLVDKRNA
ncbi:peptide/nickel transport system permease protein/glutathione transport system permease protein [Microbacterium resistens]|uniref:Peptide/nickel transport system permease protein/glutathione transport system permease protein n=1 Tax=Microbacterium resistens TaxID=156977 RepID=A0ABU1S9D6_9MICO|nr:ABC transporter permease [Microbacterium resistens]MDR6866224.1 peptide/nickel transport system permease protein/glutathione transport system permease protein [Microbacterium resistens]